MASRVEKSNPLPRTFYSVADVAQSMGLAERAVYRALDRGDLPEVRIGARRLIPAQAFDTWVASFAQPA